MYSLDSPTLYCTHVDTELNKPVAIKPGGSPRNLLQMQYKCRVGVKRPLQNLFFWTHRVHLATRLETSDFTFWGSGIWALSIPSSWYGWNYVRIESYSACCYIRSDSLDRFADDMRMVSRCSPQDCSGIQTRYSWSDQLIYCTCTLCIAQLWLDESRRGVGKLLLDMCLDGHEVPGPIPGLCSMEKWRNRKWNTIVPASQNTSSSGDSGLVTALSYINTGVLSLCLINYRLYSITNVISCQCSIKLTPLNLSSKIWNKFLIRYIVFDCSIERK